MTTLTHPSPIPKRIPSESADLFNTGSKFGPWSDEVVRVANL